MTNSNIPAIRAKAAQQEQLQRSFLEPGKPALSLGTIARRLLHLAKSADTARRDSDHRTAQSAASINIGGTTLFVVDIDSLLRRDTGNSETDPSDLS